MSYEQKPGGGSLFKNTKKTTEKQPDYRGEVVTPEGKKYSLAAWVKEGKSGKFFSLKIDEPKANPYKQPMNLTATDNGGDLPF